MIWQNQAATAAAVNFSSTAHIESSKRAVFIAGLSSKQYLDKISGLQCGLRCIFKVSATVQADYDWNVRRMYEVRGTFLPQRLRSVSDPIWKNFFHRHTPHKLYPTTTCFVFPRG